MDDDIRMSIDVALKVSKPISEIINRECNLFYYTMSPKFRDEVPYSIFQVSVTLKIAQAMINGSFDHLASLENKDFAKIWLESFQKDIVHKQESLSPKG